MLRRLLNHHRRKVIRDQTGLKITAFIRMMALSMMSIFSIAFVYEFSRDWFDSIRLGVASLLAYISLVEAVIVVTVIPLGNRVIRSIGYRRSVLLSLIFTAVSFISLALMDYTNWFGFALPGAISLGLGVSLYWVTYYTLFTMEIHPESVGSSFGLIEAITRFGQALAPVIGAGIVYLFGYQALFYTGVILLLVSGIPMLFLKHHLHFDEVSWQEFGTWIGNQSYQQFSVAAAGRLVQDRLLANVWPIYILIILGTSVSLGLLHGIVLLTTAVVGLVIAKIFDKHPSKKIQFVATLGGMVMWSLRLLVQTFTQIALLDSFDRIFNTSVRTYFYGFTLKRAKGRETFSFVVYWHLVEAFGSLMVYLGLILILLLLGLETMWTAMIVCGMLSLLAMLLVNQNKS